MQEKLRKKRLVFKACGGGRVIDFGAWHLVVWDVTQWYACSLSPTSILNTSRLTATAQRSNTIHLPAQPAPLLPGRAGRHTQTRSRTHTHARTQYIHMHTLCEIMFGFGCKEFHQVTIWGTFQTQNNSWKCKNSYYKSINYAYLSFPKNIKMLYIVISLKEGEKKKILILFAKAPNICSELFNCCREEHPSVERPPLWANGFYIKVI